MKAREIFLNICGILRFLSSHLNYTKGSRIFYFLEIIPPQVELIGLKSGCYKVGEQKNKNRRRVIYEQECKPAKKADDA